MRLDSGACSAKVEDQDEEDEIKRTGVVHSSSDRSWASELGTTEY